MTAAALGLVLTSTVQAGDPAVECETKKLKESGTYGKCRLKAEAKGVKKAEPANYTKCDEKFGEKWDKVEGKAGGTCPTNEDRTGIQGEITVHADRIAWLLSGEATAPPSCPTSFSDVCESFNIQSGPGGFRLCCVPPGTCAEVCMGSASTSTTTTTSMTTSTTTTSTTTTTTLRQLCGHDEVCTVFVTSTGYTGDLGGLAAADSICGQHASDAGLDGPFVAWLSTSTVNAVDRLDPASGPFHTPTGCASLLAVDLTDLTDGTLTNPILFDEQCGTREVNVWTGTSPDGTVSGLDKCGDWTTTLDFAVGLAGRSYDDDVTWTYHGTTLCQNPHELYCFEQ